LYIYGVPGPLGGASTKLVHLLRLLRNHFAITVVFPAPAARSKESERILKLNAVCGCLLKDLPRQLCGVVLGVCEQQFFSSGAVREFEERGAHVVWANEMTWAFKGEAEAVRAGWIDRVLYVSEHQARALAEVHRGVTSFLTGNYIDPADYPWRERRNPIFTLGRLSRHDPMKYPLNFPSFFEEFRLSDVRYRIMAWSPEVHRQYRWHRFGPEWELLPANREPAARFLHSLDVFVYPLGHRIQESWGRAVVEAMLTGAVPVVPAGQQFDKLLVHGESGFICHAYSEWKACVRELCENYPLRLKVSRQAAAHARERLCHPEEHRRRWIEALSF
jgi:hypothetical protein